MMEAADAPRVCWFVGASYGSTDDQTARFLNQGIWDDVAP